MLGGGGDGRGVTADKPETTVRDGVSPFVKVKLVNILTGHRDISRQSLWRQKQVRQTTIFT